MRPHWDEILAARNTNIFGRQQEKGPAGNNRTIAALEIQLYQLAKKKSKREARLADVNNEGEKLPTGGAKGAGDAFDVGYDKANHKKH